MLFVDTSYWVALKHRRDVNHETAVELARGYRGVPLATSNLVLGETWSMIRRRDGHRAAVDWLDRVAGGIAVRLHRVDPAVEDEAWAWLRVHDERPYSFVDATSFALMRRLDIREALAFDGDFAAAGFVELRP